MNPNDILARLQNGETAEDIAAEMSSMLNEAIDAYEAEAAKATRDTLIESAAANVVSSLLDFTNLVAPELVEHVTEEDEAELTALLVAESANLGKLAQFAMMMAELDETKKTCGKTDCKCNCVKEDKPVVPSAEDILNDFLKKNFLS